MRTAAREASTYPSCSHPVAQTRQLSSTAKSQTDEMLAFIRPNWQPPYRAHLGTIGRVRGPAQSSAHINPYR